MVKKIFGKWILVLILGAMLTGNLYAQTDCQLNGRWVRLANDGRSLGGWEFTFNNGTFERAFSNALGRSINATGIYMIVCGGIIMVPTHMNANFGFPESDSRFITIEEAALDLFAFARNPGYERNPPIVDDLAGTLSTFSVIYGGIHLSDNRLNLPGVDMTLTRIY